MSQQDVRIWRDAESLWESPVPVSQPIDNDLDCDFPPTLHPGREFLTFSIFVLMVVGLIVWGSEKLISLI